MKKEQLIKSIKDEMEEIIKDVGGKSVIKEWECLDIDDMESNDAFNRGYYRALECILLDLIK